MSKQTINRRKKWWAWVRLAVNSARATWSMWQRQQRLLRSVELNVSACFLLPRSHSGHYDVMSFNLLECIDVSAPTVSTYSVEALCSVFGLLFDSEDGDITFLRNGGRHLPCLTAIPSVLSTVPILSCFSKICLWYMSDDHLQGSLI
jgi:hypothetical protein